MLYFEPHETTQKLLSRLPSVKLKASAAGVLSVLFVRMYCQHFSFLFSCFDSPPVGLVLLIVEVWDHTQAHHTR